MSYNYKGNPISTYIKYITTDTSSQFSGSSIAPLNTSYLPTFTSSVDEKPNTLGFFVQNTDISNYSIANYVEGNTSVASLSIPSWATSMRVVLVGAGGSGGTGVNPYQPGRQFSPQNNQNHEDFLDHDGGSWQDQQRGGPQQGYGHAYENLDQDYRYTQGPSTRYQHTHQHNVGNTPGLQYGYAGGGGGGGGFVYFNTTDINSVSISVGTSSGEHTSMVAGGTTYIAGGGISGQASTPGGSENNSSSGGIITRSRGPAASGNPGGNSGIYSYLSPNYTTTFPHGKGGPGGGSGGSNGASNGGTGGNGGYYRVYYLL